MTGPARGELEPITPKNAGPNTKGPLFPLENRLTSIARGLGKVYGTAIGIAASLEETTQGINQTSGLNTDNKPDSQQVANRKQLTTETQLPQIEPAYLVLDATVPAWRVVPAVVAGTTALAAGIAVLQSKKEIPRRDILKLLGFVSGSAILAACAQATTTPSPTKERLTTFAGSLPVYDPVPRNLLPADIVPSSELEQEYHVRIWNAPNLTLHLRRGIDRDPYFQSLIKRDPYYGTFPETDIVIVEGPVIQSRFLTDEQKGVPGILTFLEKREQEALVPLKEDVEKQRGQQLTKYREEAMQAELDFHEGKLSNQQFDSMITGLKAAYSFYLNGPTSDDLVASTPKSFYNQEIDDLPEGKKRRHHFIYVSAQLPRPPSSFPSVEDLGMVNDQNDPYPIKRVTPAVVSRHEIKHGLGINHPETDYAVAMDIQAAHSALESGDNSGYWVVLEYRDGTTFIS